MTPSVHIRPARLGDATDIAHEKTVTINGKELREVGYGWDDLDAIV